MMKKYSIILIALLLTGMAGCGEEGDIDMSNIDFSNIEDLYAQPLPVIQKAVQGKWQLAKTCGGVIGCVDTENIFITITPDEIINENIVNGERRVKSYTWKSKRIKISDKTVNSYIMWPDGEDESTQGGMNFECIVNDILLVSSFSLTSDYSVFSSSYVRVK
jgi:hypothetical protein